MTNPFILPKEQYKRNYDIITGYVEQSSFFLHKTKSIPLEKATEFVKKTIAKDGARPLHNPDSLVLEQESQGNRIRADRPFFDFVKDVVVNQYILSPAMIAYLPPTVRKSTSAAFTEDGIAGRNFSKQEMFEAQRAGDKNRESIKNSEQNAKKVDINALSGMAGFSANVLYIKSGHPSLTSMCRSATSYGNAINEKFLSGNRHYDEVELILSDITSVCTNINLDLIREVIEENNLNILTAEEVIESIHRSSDLYMLNEAAMKPVHELVHSLSDIERAAYAYVSDFYTFTKYNDSFSREMIADLIEVRSDVPDNIDGIMKSLNGDEKAFVALLTADELKLVDQNDVKGTSPEVWSLMAQKAMTIKMWYKKYAKFIAAFWRPEFLPQSIGNIEHMVRRVVLTSDTDSTIFTTQDWVEWYTDTLERSTSGDRVWYAMTFISTQLIVHGLAMLSTNMGVDANDLHRLAMKNEYAFPVFALTTMSKHYYAFKSAQEGVIYTDYKMEVKGVNLRSSSVNPKLIDGAHEMMSRIMGYIDTGRKFTVEEIYDEIYDLEMNIYNSVRKGESEYLKTAQIKSMYSNPRTLSTPLFYYEMWNDVFASKYGSVQEPPLAVVKVPLSIDNKSDIDEWLEKWEDTELRDKMRLFLGKSGRTKFSMVMLPHSILSEHGIPDEIMMGIDTRKLTHHALKSYYMVLESLGIYKVDDNNHILVQDFHTRTIREVVSVQ